MTRSPRPRRTANLSKSLHQQINMYALAAGAAGVGMLALAQPAEGKIIYTPADLWIAQGSSVLLDVNHDGIADFSLSLYSVGITTYEVIDFLGVTPRSNNQVWWSGSVWAAALPKNVRVDSAAPFTANSRYMVTLGTHYSRRFGGGPWLGVKQAYLGFQLQINGKTHYGWARLHVIAQLDPPVMPQLIAATLTGYAYETIPNKAIITGKTKGP